MQKPRQTKSAGGVVINSEGLVLVVSQHGTSWSLPKGHIDPGEDALAAAKREIYEEAGIRKLNLVKELGSYKRFRIGLDGSDDKSEFKIITMFLFRTSEVGTAPVDPENPEARWVSVEDVEKLLTHQRDREFFARIKYNLSI
jgi:8-oxo-dGTP pyrophosphatase MutT (NUDIX family)